MNKIIGLTGLLIALAAGPALAQDGGGLSREARIDRFLETRGVDLTDDQRGRLLERLNNRQGRGGDGSFRENLTDDQRAQIRARFEERRANGGGFRDRREDSFDRRENRFDRREDRIDERFTGGPRDRREDRFDRREDRFDRTENRIDRRNGPREGRGLRRSRR